MKREHRYGVKSLERDFPTNEACLNFIFNTLHKPECSCGGTYRLIAGYRKFQCSKCRFRISPTAGTIFHKSDTPLTLWFKAILVFSNAKSGISAKELERSLEVTYKCAYRILSHIRKALKQDEKPLKGDVEVDTGYFGGRGHGGEYNKNFSEVMEKKAVVIVGVERGGKIKAEVVKGAGSLTMKDFLEKNVAVKGTSLITDDSAIYKGGAKKYDLHSVNHSKGQYVREDIHINTVETFFAHLKRSIRGTFKSVSRERLQEYLNAFVFHYNNRHSDRERFGALLDALLQPAG